MLKSKGVPVLWVGLPAIRGTEGDLRHALPRRPVSRRRRQGRHHLCRCLGRLRRRGRPLPPEGPRLRRPDPPVALLPTACISPSPARASWRTMSSARSPACSPGRSGRSRCRARPATPDANAVPGQPAPRRWPDRSCRWWPRPSAPINCSAAPARVRPAVDALRRAHAGEGRSAGARRPAAPTISPGRAAKSAVSRPRAIRRSPPIIAERNGGGSARTEADAAARCQQQHLQQQQKRQPQQRSADAASGRRRPAARRCATSSAASARRRASPRRRQPARRADADRPGAPRPPGSVGAIGRSPAGQSSRDY